MNGQDKFVLERKTRVRYRVLRLKTGFYNIFHSKYYVFGIVGYIAFAILVWGILNLEYSNLSEVVMFNIKITKNETIIDEIEGFDILQIDRPEGTNEELERFELDEPPI